ncbi:phosphoglycolate phosphatase [Acidihalobacter ferrooxydans]|uniref:phosphoglycolate phosphatase n=1 Tax=Acidihalobacter ferrooxydans TaxID=1765967 RepID=A0A1P8UG35_9GAMM|nr:phosphoglycolate phosphatase [Acidihalobacter ferrooxydans]APZ42818.1 phosphoglycolate phosphatase [Acidihalobacter ferrooxydans]
MPEPCKPEPILRGVLFDLDGTLLDTAPDMAGALTALRAEEGLPPLPFEQMRGHVSHGSKGLVDIGFGTALAPERFAALRQRFLDIYAASLCQGTRLFPGMEALLRALESAGIVWGIVTNKPGYLTDPLLHTLGLGARSRCVVSGDTLAQRKPHPAPLLHAATLCGLAPGDCLYIGDAERDIAAGRAAGMRTAIARWGYIDAADRPQTWGADAALEAPADTLSRFFPDARTA